MTLLHDAYRHSAWTTRTLLDVVSTLPEEKLREPIHNAYQPVLGILSHMFEVEATYLALIQGHEPADAGQALSSVDEARAAATRIAEGYERWFATGAAAETRRPVHIPWFERDVALEDALLQVLQHSTQHRSDIALLASMEGAEIPYMDYVLWKLGFVGDNTSQ